MEANLTRPLSSALQLPSAFQDIVHRVQQDFVSDVLVCVLSQSCLVVFVCVFPMHSFVFGGGQRDLAATDGVIRSLKEDEEAVAKLSTLSNALVSCSKSGGISSKFDCSG